MGSPVDHTGEVCRRSLETEGRTLKRRAWLYDAALALVTFGAYKRLYSMTLEAAGVADGDRVLDIGCGTGLLTEAVARRLDGGSVVGIDASRSMINAARRKRASEVARFMLAAAEDLPFGDSSFDVAVSSLFFHHVEGDLRARAAAEMARVLRPGGRVAIADFAPPWTPFGRLYLGAASLFGERGAREHAAGVMPQVLAGAGFIGVVTRPAALGCLAIFTAAKPL